MSTVTLTLLLVVVLPAASRPTAVKVCAPSVAAVVSHATLYASVVSSAPRSTPSTWNWTPITPTSSAAVAVTVTEAPETVDPALGAVIETVGGVVSAMPAEVTLISMLSLSLSPPLSVTVSVAV